MTERILLVDDDPNILHGYQRNLRKLFVIEPALSGEEGLEAVRNQGPYAVVVADMRMPGINGVEFLTKVKSMAPDTVRLMLTGNADQQTALDAVNEGHIFRFLNKPCSPETFAKALQAGLEQHRLIMAERELLAKTLRGSIQVLADILGLVNPAAFARASRVQRIVVQIDKELHTDKGWLIEIAALLSQIGCVAVPQDILNKVVNQKPLTTNELKAYESHPEIAKSLLSNIPRMEEVADIIAHQNECWSSEGNESHPIKTGMVPLGSRILKIALDWDDLVSSDIEPNMALAEINDRKAEYDPEVLAALHRMLHVSKPHVIRRVNFRDLADGVILAEDIKSLRGTLLCAKGQVVSPSMRARLKNYVINVGIKGPIKIFVPLEEAENLSDSSFKTEENKIEPLKDESYIFDFIEEATE